MIQEKNATVRKPKDRDFIETPEGLLFCVVDYLHPSDKYTAYLKYSPAAQGPWQRDGAHYHRDLAFYHAHQVAVTLDDLEKQHPQYVHHCPVRNMRFSMVPRDRVQTYYAPEARLAEILAGPKDTLEEETARVALEIQRAAGIPMAQLGVTGSILLKIHSPVFSDIDLMVYGRENTRRLRQALADRALAGLSSMDADYRADWRAGVMQHFGLTLDQADWLVARRWNFTTSGGGGHVVSIHPARVDDEIDEVYGDHTYHSVGMARIQAVIAGAEDSIFLPAVYQVGDVQTLDGPAVRITEVYSYESLFDQIGAAGQRVEARGKLERIDEGPLHRLVVGSSHRAGPEYLLPC